MAALKPIADASVGNWTGTNPANLYGNLDEDTADSGDAIRSGSLPDTCKLQMAAPSTLDNGLYVDYVLGAIGAVPIKAQVRLYDGALLKDSWTHDPVPQTQTPYSRFVAASTLAGANPANLFVEFARMTPTTTAQRLDSYTLSPSTINLGGSAALSWATSNASAVTINGSAVAADGTQNVSPAVTTNYTIIVSGSAANISSSRLLTVLPSGGGGAGEVEGMPPETILINSEGNWAISGGPGGVLTLNGVAMSAGGVSLVEKYNDAIMWRNVGGGDAWSVRLAESYDQDSPPPRTGTLFGANSDIASAGALLDADDLPFIGPSNTPDIWILEYTGVEAIEERTKYDMTGGGTGEWPVSGPYNKEFGIDPTYGFAFMRGSNNPDPNATFGGDTYHSPPPGIVNGTKIFRDFMALGDGAIGSPENDREAANVGYLFRFEGDLGAAMNEGGLKLSGIENDTGFGFPEYPENTVGIHWMYPPVDGQCALRTYKYDEELPGFAVLDDCKVFLRPDRWYWLEYEMVLNTPGVADGHFAIYVNGHKIFERNDWKGRTNPLTRLRSASHQVYHGGTFNPRGVFHVSMGHFCASTSYIGVPDFMFSSSGGTFPAWRSEEWAVDTIQYIPDTEEMNGDMQLAPGSLQTYGRAALDLEVWTGMANDGNAVMYGVAMGGHMWGWCNKGWKVDFSEDEPRCNLMGWGTPETNYNGSTGGDYVPSLAEMNAGGQLVHYNDEATHPLGSKRPSARQNYYNTHYNGTLSPPRVFLIGTEVGFGGNGVMRGNIEAWNCGTNDYDVAGSWGDLPEPLYSTQPTVTAKAAARHPTTQSIYVTMQGYWAKMRPNGTWFVFSVSNQSNGLWYHYFQFHGTCIDNTRHRFACLEGGTGRGIPLGIQYVGIAAIETEASNVTTGHAIALQGDAQGLIDLDGPSNGGGALVYDPDNDRYVALWGDVSFGRPARAYAIDPDDGTVTLLDEFTSAPVNGFQGRVAYLAALGGIATVWRWDSPIAFLPTRTSP